MFETLMNICCIFLLEILKLGIVVTLILEFCLHIAATFIISKLERLKCYLISDE